MKSTKTLTKVEGNFPYKYVYTSSKIFSTYKKIC